MNNTENLLIHTLTKIAEVSKQLLGDLGDEATQDRLARELEKLEVITTPVFRYDGEGVTPDMLQSSFHSFNQVKPAPGDK